MANNSFNASIKIGVQDETQAGFEKASGNAEKFFTKLKEKANGVFSGMTPMAGTSQSRSSQSGNGGISDSEYRQRKERREEIQNRRENLDVITQRGAEINQQIRGNTGVGSELISGNLTSAYDLAQKGASTLRRAYLGLKDMAGIGGGDESSPMPSSAGPFSASGRGIQNQKLQIQKAEIHIQSGNMLGGGHGGSGGVLPRPFGGKYGTNQGSGGPPPQTSAGPNGANGKEGSLGMVGSKVAPALMGAGALAGVVLGAAQSLADARLQYLSSQLGTSTAVGLAFAGGTGDPRKSLQGTGMGAAQKGQAALTLLQGVTGSYNGGTDAKSLERDLNLSTRFGLGQGMGAMYGAQIFSQIQNISGAQNVDKVNNLLGDIVSSGMSSGVGKKGIGQFVQQVVQSSGGAIDAGVSASGEQVISGMSMAYSMLGKESGGRMGLTSNVVNKIQSDLSGGLSGGGMLNNIALMEFMAKNPKASPLEIKSFMESGITPEKIDMLRGSDMLKGDQGSMLLNFATRMTTKEASMVQGGLLRGDKPNFGGVNALSTNIKDEFKTVEGESAIFHTEKMGTTDASITALTLMTGFQGMLESLVGRASDAIKLLEKIAGGGKRK